MAAQHSDDTVAGGSNINGGIAWTDDAVWVDLWPTGPAGFQYQFESNPNGAHNEASSENTAFAPAWESRGAATSGGYVVTMAIPLRVIHGAHPGTWRAQFVRYVRSSGRARRLVVRSVANQSRRSGSRGTARHSAGREAAVAADRASACTRWARSRAARSAAARRASAPTFRFRLRRRRPSSARCIPTIRTSRSISSRFRRRSISASTQRSGRSSRRPRRTTTTSTATSATAFERFSIRRRFRRRRKATHSKGKQGAFGLAGYDAIGDGRNDAAEALNYTSDDNHWNAALQHVVADVPGVVDVSERSRRELVQRKVSFGVCELRDRPRNQRARSGQGNWLDAGGGFINQQYALFGSYRYVGSYFNPVDGFDSHPGIAVTASTARACGRLRRRISYRRSASRDSWTATKERRLPAWRRATIKCWWISSPKARSILQLYSGSDYWRFGSELTPISQNAGFSLTYHSGMQNNLNNFPTHGSSATPTSIQWYTGNYGVGGRLDTWFRNSTIRVGNRGALTLTLDDTAQYFHAGSPNIQWFEEIAYAYQVSANSSFAIGVRRVDRLSTAAQRRRQLRRRVLEHLDRLPSALAPRRDLRRLRQSEYADHGAAGDLQADLLRRRREGDVKPSRAASGMRGMRLFASCSWLAVLYPLAASAAPVAPEDLFKLTLLSNAAISPDGRARAGRGLANERSERYATIARSSWSTLRPDALTHNVTKHLGDGDYAWMPDGRSFVFVRSVQSRSRSSIATRWRLARSRS